MLVSQITDDDLTHKVIDKLLFQNLEDTGEHADCIIVLGSIKAAKYRVPVAVDAYKAGRSSKIMLCGGKQRDFPEGRCSEAEHMRQAALDLGVDEKCIILENSSMNTVENLQLGLATLQQSCGLTNINRILLVTTAYHMRRSLAIARSLFPENISIVPCPANDNNTRRENWMYSSVGIERAKGEAKRLINYIRNGVIPDFEI